MNVIERAVTENYNHVFRLQHWNNSIYNRVGIVFVKRGSASFGNRSHNPLWI